MHSEEDTLLFASVAIIRYLATKFGSEHWYPKDLQTRARIDEALAWFPGNLRSGLFFHAVSMGASFTVREVELIFVV